MDVLVFTKKKYIKSEGSKDYKKQKNWVDAFNGKKAEELRSIGYYIKDNWCKTIKTGGKK